MKRLAWARMTAVVLAAALFLFTAPTAGLTKKPVPPPWGKKVCQKLGLMCAAFGKVGGNMTMMGFVADPKPLTALGFVGLSKGPHRAHVEKLPDGRFKVSTRSMTDRNATPQVKIISLNQ
ncbi:MAG: hypothetical protein KJ621_20885 [Proteobacteria bacterium]|nr:hypothetical protein [Pseudomonadota bacterium]MBU1740187.1 hypothetical protein [Pseudomonadota bacterium]